ncbi:MAG: tyrosine-type recombinase/integrase [Sulfuricella denitrificans]|nr:tyrosine-type recombinase/integrase [Sulfuricella denitrificans]
MINDLIEYFLEFKRHNAGRSERTVQVYRLALSRLVDFFAERDPLLATHDELVVFSGIWLHKRGLTDPLSRRTHIAAVREFYRWLLDSQHVRGNPAEGLPYPKVGRKIPRVMTLKSAEKLMWAPDFGTFEGVRDGAMLALLVGCGLRASGLVNLNVSNVVEDEVDGKARLILKVKEKGNKERRIPVPPEADMLLRLYMAHDDLNDIDRILPSGDQVLFVSTMNRTCSIDEYRGERRRLNRRAVLQMVAKYGQRVGIPSDQLHPHAMRHLFGTELIEDDVNMLNAQKLLGHADPKSTEIYTHTAMRKLTREIDRANPLAKMRTPVSDLLKELNKKN